MHALLEGLHRSLALRLRRVHRRVRVAQQILDTVGPVAVGDADRGGHAQAAPRDLEGGHERIDDPVGHQAGRVLLLGELDQDRELVAAEPRCGVAGRSVSWIRTATAWSSSSPRT